MKTVLITGGNRGIGKQIATNLAAEGWQVVITYYKNAQSALALQERYENITALCCDVSDYNQVEQLFVMIQQRFLTIDALVNCAGISYVGLVQDMSPCDVGRVLATNLNGTIYTCQKAIPFMLKEQAGAIVNISSVWGIKGASCEAVYSASKGGVNAFTKALAQELAPSGIRVNTVCPGVVQTEMLDCFSPQDLQDLAEQTPLGRLGTPNDVAHMVRFLLSEQAQFITGQEIVVDGGFTL